MVEFAQVSIIDVDITIYMVYGFYVGLPLSYVHSSVAKDDEKPQH